MGAIRYSFPIGLVPTYTLPAKERSEVSWESFSPIALKQWSAAAYLVSTGKCSAHPLLAHV